MRERDNHHVLLVSGSLRAASYNRALLNCVPGLAPPRLTFALAPDLALLPHYAEELDTPEPPPAVARWREAVERAAAVIIATPEYNHSVPGALKNGIDWASRPYGSPSLRGKVALVMVGTQGRGFGFTGRAEVVRILHDMSNFVLSAPQIVIHEVQKKIVTAQPGVARLDDAVATHLVRAQLLAMQDALDGRAGELMLGGLAHSARLKSEAQR